MIRSMVDLCGVKPVSWDSEKSLTNKKVMDARKKHPYVLLALMTFYFLSNNVERARKVMLL